MGSNMDQEDAVKKNIELMVKLMILRAGMCHLFINDLCLGGAGESEEGSARKTRFTVSGCQSDGIGRGRASQGKRKERA